MKILKTKRFFLKQGARATLRTTWKKPYTKWGYDISTTFWTNPKEAVQWLFIMWGAPANDATTKTSVGTTSVAVDVIWKTEYEYSAMYMDNVATNYTNNMTFLALSQNVINQGSGGVSDALATANIA